MSTEQKQRSFGTFESTVELTDLITPWNKHIRFAFSGNQKMNFKAGQFVQVFIPQADKPRRTSYSIASSPKNNTFIELCVTKVVGGVSSTWLHNLKKGDPVTLMGPLGKFCLPEPLPRDIVFVATGSGIAPFRSMINSLLESKTNKQLYLLFGNRHDDDILYKQEWESLAQKEKNFQLFLTLSQPIKWTGPKGYVGDKITEFVPNPVEKDFYICGLSKMINAVQDKLLSLGVPQTQIHYEKYD